MRNSVINRITELARQRSDVFLITGDAGFGVLDEFKHEFPDRFLNLGIAEQNMISFAAGLSLVGYKVFLYNLAPFVLYRCYEQVRNDICYQKLPVTLIGIGSGVTYAPQGATHYSVEDIAVARSIPNLIIFSPADPLEASRCIEYTFNKQKPVYIRLAKSGEPVLHENEVIDVTKPIAVRDGRDVAILFHGSISVEVIKAVDGLKPSPIVISIPMLQPLNFADLLLKLRDVHTIITVEEHYVTGGLGSIICEWIAKNRLSFRTKNLGIKNEFIHLIKNNKGMRQHYGISSLKIKALIKEAFSSG